MTEPVPQPSASHEPMSAPKGVSLSASAAKRIKQVLKNEPEGALLRISVLGGGCSGFQYAFEITQESSDDDLLVSRDGANMVIDSVSLEFLHGAEVDFVDDLIGQSFKIHNPNATASCGCGTSFAV